MLQRVGAEARHQLADTRTLAISATLPFLLSKNLGRVLKEGLASAACSDVAVMSRRGTGLLPGLQVVRPCTSPSPRLALVHPPPVASAAVGI